jgi:hypothetical protein
VQALLETKQECHGSTPNTIAVISAKSLTDNILPALQMMLLVILSFYFFPFFIKQLIPKPAIVFVLNTALAKSFSKAALDGSTVLRRACK